MLLAPEYGWGSVGIAVGNKIPSAQESVDHRVADGAAVVVSERCKDRAAVFTARPPAQLERIIGQDSAEDRNRRLSARCERSRLE
ncbi:hypothetical protein SRHO_G00187820 [Serrasalmus rhombeus]